MTEFKQLLQQYRRYLDYLEEHYDNVQEAFKRITSNRFQQKAQERGKLFKWINDDFDYGSLRGKIEDHDLSKFTGDEFIAYRAKWAGTEIEASLGDKYNKTLDQEFKKACSHHMRANDYHWQTWTSPGFTGDLTHAIIHNFCDWYAMSMKFGEKPLDYYRKNINSIDLPPKAVKEMELIEDIVLELFPVE